MFHSTVGRVQTRTQPMKLATRAPLSRAAGLTSFSASREMSGMRSAGMMRARSPQPLMHRPRKSPDLGEVRPTRLEITTSNNYRVSNLFLSKNAGTLETSTLPSPWLSFGDVAMLSQVLTDT